MYKNCGWWKNCDCIFGFSVKSYVRNTINLSCAKILLTSVISVYLFWVLDCVTHISLHHCWIVLVKWTKRKLSLSWYKNKGKCFLLLFDIICLKFLGQKTLFQLFLKWRLQHFLSLYFSFQNNIILYRLADWLALSCNEVCFVTEKKDIRVGMTKIESYSSINCVLSG